MTGGYHIIVLSIDRISYLESSGASRLVKPTSATLLDELSVFDKSRLPHPAPDQTIYHVPLEENGQVIGEN